eukprot:jgi/Orpsp1_1/1178180/evm.model.c7180000064339.1
MSNVINWTENEVGRWLDDIKLGQYKDKFKENNITGFVLFDLTHKDLKEMGIYDLGERAKILIELKKFYYVILNSKDVTLSQNEIKKRRDTVIQNHKNIINNNDSVNNQSNKIIQNMILNNKNQNRKTIIQSSQPINIYGMKYNRNNDVNMQREQDKMNNIANKNRQTIKINKRSSINRRSIGMLLRNNSPKYV